MADCGQHPQSLGRQTSLQSRILRRRHLGTCRCGRFAGSNRPCLARTGGDKMKKSETKRATVQTTPKPKDKIKVITLPNDVALANIVAHEWIQQLATRPPDSGNYCVALSGGRIAKTFSSAVANLAKARKLDFKSVHFFWGDERCVPPTDAESNFAI